MTNDDNDSDDPDYNPETSDEDILSGDNGYKNNEKVVLEGISSNAYGIYHLYLHII